MKVTFKTNVLFKGKRYLFGGSLDVSEEEAKHLSENGLIEAPAPAESLKKIEALADEALKNEVPANVPAPVASQAQGPLAFDIDAMIADASKQEEKQPEEGATPPKAASKKSGKKGKA